MTREQILKNLKGVFCPVVTPFNRRGDVDNACFQGNLTRLAGIGLAGILVAGSTGEAPYLTERERLQLIEMAREMRHSKVAQLLNQNLRQEAATLKKMKSFSKKVKPAQMMSEEEQDQSERSGRRAK